MLDYIVILYVNIGVLILTSIYFIYKYYLCYDHKKSDKPNDKPDDESDNESENESDNESDNELICLAIKEKINIKYDEFETIGYLPWKMDEFQRYNNFNVVLETVTNGSTLVIQIGNQEIEINENGFISIPLNLPLNDQRLVIKMKKIGNNNPNIFGLFFKLSSL